MENQVLIVHLIREDLRNKRLTFSLEALGFDCSYYMLNISPVILELAGFSRQPDALHEWYTEQVERALEEITFSDLTVMLEKWSARIGEALLSKSGQE